MVTWFRIPTNLHAVWDTNLIEHQKLSYTEYARWIDKGKQEDYMAHGRQGMEVWLKEAMDYREKIYDLPKDRQLGYEYNYLHIKHLNSCLLKAGHRLAYILNDLYKK